MAHLNKVFLIGNLTRDPELKSTPSGRKVCELRLAVSRRYRTAQNENRDETCFVDVRVWDRQAEICKDYLQKGSSLLVEGRLVFEQWDRKDGTKGSRHSVLAERIQLLDRRRSVPNEPTEGPEPVPPPDAGGEPSSGTGKAGAPSPDGGGDEEDLPF
jgi:single-strand DNA-binding protein